MTANCFLEEIFFQDSGYISMRKFFVKWRQSFIGVSLHYVFVLLTNIPDLKTLKLNIHPLHLQLFHDR